MLAGRARAEETRCCEKEHFEAHTRIYPCMYLVLTLSYVFHHGHEPRRGKS